MHSNKSKRSSDADHAAGVTTYPERGKRSVKEMTPQLNTYTFPWCIFFILWSKGKVINPNIERLATNLVGMMDR